MGSAFDRMGGRPPLRPFLRAAAAFATEVFRATDAAELCQPLRSDKQVGKETGYAQVEIEALEVAERDALSIYVTSCANSIGGRSNERAALQHGSESGGSHRSAVAAITSSSARGHAQHRWKQLLEQRAAYPIDFGGRTLSCKKAQPK